MISDDIKVLRVQHSIPFLLREPLSRVLDALEKRTAALIKIADIESAWSEPDFNKTRFTSYSAEELRAFARAALEEK